MKCEIIEYGNREIVILVWIHLFRCGYIGSFYVLWIHILVLYMHHDFSSIRQ
jgi:hypothetical protein